MRQNGVHLMILGGGLTILAWALLPGARPVPPGVAAQAPPLLGVPDDFRDKAKVAFRAYPQSFQTAMEGGNAQNNAAKNIRLYEVCPDLWCGPQQTGDCVSWGGVTPIYVRACVVAARNKLVLPTRADYPFPPFAYGVTRVTERGGRPRCGSAGAYPSDFVAGFIAHGYVTVGEAAQAGYEYSGSLADRWGCQGPPAALLEKAQVRSGGDAYPIRSRDEWRDAIVNGYPTTVAIPWSPGKTYQRGTKCCLAFNGRNLGGHQLCCIAYDGSDGGIAFLLYNSHGPGFPNHPAASRDGTPPGSVWVEGRWADWVIEQGELWAISNVPGFVADELDLRVFDDLRISGHPQKQRSVATN